MDDLDLFSHFNDDEEEKEEEPKEKEKMDTSPDDPVAEIENDTETEEKITGKKRPLPTESDEKEVEPSLKRRKYVSCSHEICYPKNYSGPKTFLIGGENNKPSLKFKKYEFQLDKFQEESILCIENNESVLVSAHTSAGKTAVAEYAIAHSLQTNSRVVYTSPIKALSNQKYRDLKSMFGDVGLITGDVTISPNANCLIMTTEILRTMLYKGHSLLNAVKWVIFDEVHYLRDAERGVVWEESIILLPNEIKYVFLSATIPNATEFAGWIAELKQQPIHVIYTDHRPTPLKHYAYPLNGKGIFLVKDENNRFRNDNFQKLCMDHKNSGGGGGGFRRKREHMSMDRLRKEKSEHVMMLLKLIVERDFFPVIFFSFSRRDCEDYATFVKRMTLTDEKEQKMIKSLFHNALENLNEEDRSLPQIHQLLPLLVKGVGVHHSGLLPIMKELVEILFSEGLIKVLFATETFAMGLNMPARTCVFTSIKKFDGVSRRFLSVSEYTQMSGRAGRRGIDKRGLVMVMARAIPEQHQFRELLIGEIDPLKSAFHLSYFTILNLFRVEMLDARYIMDRSFLRYQYEQRQVPKLRNELNHTMKELRENPKCRIFNENLVGQYSVLYEETKALDEQLHRQLTHPRVIVPYLQTGRIIKLRGGKWGWGIVVFCKRMQINPRAESNFLIDILLPVKHLPKKRKRGRRHNNKKSSRQQEIGPHDLENDSLCNGKYGPIFSSSGGNFLQFPESNKNLECVICPITLRKIDCISQIRINLPHNLHTRHKRNEVFQKFRVALESAASEYDGEIPVLDPVKDLKVPDGEFLLDSLKEKSKKKHEVLKRWIKVTKKTATLIDDEEDRLDNEEEEEEEEEDGELEGDIDFEKYEFKLRQEMNNFEFKKSLERRKIEIRHAMNLVGQKGILNKFDLMKKLLEKLGFISYQKSSSLVDQQKEKSSYVLSLKGKFAAEISNGDCIVITELMLGTGASNLDFRLLGAILSCFVFEQQIGKQNPFKTMPPLLVENYQNFVHQASSKVERAKSEVGLDGVDVGGQRSSSFHPGLMKVTYDWLDGHAFFQIANQSTVFEGEIIRVMRRLEELLRQITCAVKSVGLENQLEEKLKKISSTLKRDIAFCSSLYI